MNSGYYAAFTGLVSRMQALDVLANNLANVSTTGFRGQHEFYRSVTVAQGNQSLSPLNRVINDFAVLGGSDVDLRQGNLESTGNNLDLAVSGPAFFSVRTAAGARYTRNGSFHMSTVGQIVNDDQNPVLGPNGPILVTQGQVTVAEDGTVAVDGGVVGSLKLTEFVAGTKLLPEGSSNFIAPPGTEKPAVNSKVEQGMLESSNLSAVQATVTLMVLQRHAEMLERTLSIFQNDFNRTAVQDLPRD